MADIKKIKVGNTTYDIKDATKLPKVTYEWNKEFAAGSNGAISLGRYNIYDSQLTFDITSTTNQSLSGKLVIATQNGTIHQAKVFGDASGTLVSKLIIYQSAISNSRSWVEVFCNFNGWSKNKVHIYAVALNNATVQKQMTSVTISNGVPAAANVTSGDTKWTGTIVNDFNHSHGISIKDSTGTNQLTLAHGTKYALTAGGKSFVFTTPSDNNTHNSHAIISGTKSDGSTQIKGSASSGDIILGDSGVTAGAYGDTNPQTPGYNATFKVPSISVNAKGIVTAIGEHTVKIPDNSSLVPYTGATNDVSLGNHSLLISDQTAASGPIIKVSGMSKSEDDTSITIKSTSIEFAGTTAIKTLLHRGALNITDSTNTILANKGGFKAQFKEDPDGDGHFDTYYSTYEYDGITHNGKKLLLPEKEGTIALTNDLSTLLDKGTSSTNVNQVVYNPVEMKKNLTLPSLSSQKMTISEHEVPGFSLDTAVSGNYATSAITLNGCPVGTTDISTISTTTISQNAGSFSIDCKAGGYLGYISWSKDTGWCINDDPILTDSDISTQQWKLTSTSGTVTTVNICTK